MPFRATLVRSLAALSIALGPPAIAQINSGSITGIITDPQKAVVPNAKVEVVEGSTQFSYSTSSNNSGEYTVPYLKAGVYTVTVTAQGFPVYRVSGVTVETGSTVRTDVALELSKVATQVEVSATADHLQTDSTTNEGAVGREVMDSVPNANQNPLYYASLLEGVVGRTELSDTTAFQSFGIGYDGRRWQSAINVDGATAFSASIQLDGLSVTSGAWNESAVLPNVDSLQEVRVVTSNFTAEFGRGMGAIKMATKSGSNQWHGSARDSFRNEAFNANTFRNNANNIARAAFRVNDVGVTIGGPILKDKLFIFTSYDILRHKDTPQWMWNVPTAQQRIGDFSQTLVSGTNGVPTPVGIFNPDSVSQTSSTVYTRDPFPGAIIPPSQISPYALKLMNVYPLPNRAPTDAFGANNFFTQLTRPFSRSSNNSRLDYRHSRHSVYASGGVSIGSINTPSPFPNPQWFGQPTTNSGGTPARNITDDNPYVQLGDTVVIGPTVVLDVRGGVNRIHSNSLNYPPHSFTAADYDSLGIPRSVQSVMPQFGAAPDLASPGYYSNAAWAQYSGKQERQTNSSVTGSITKIRGKWTHKAGGEFRVYQGNYTDYQFNAADYQAAVGNFTAQNITAAGASTNNNAISQQGFAGANALVGGGGWLVPPNPSSRPALTSKYIAMFSQNDWRATSRLTLNLGVRYEIQPGPTDRFNRSTAIDLTQPSPFAAAGSPLSQPYTGMIVFPGNNGLARNLWNTTWTNLGPRLGAAYQIGQNLVVRGGYGVAYGANNTGWYDGPFAYNQGAFTPGTQILPFGTSPNGALAGHFWDAVASPLIIPPGANSAAAQLYGNGGAFFNVNSERPGRVQMWNVFLERQVSKTWFVSVGYNGSHGVHLFQSRYPLQNNQFIPSSVLASWKATYISTNAGTNPANTQVQNPLQPATGTLLPFVGALAQRTIPQADLYYPHLDLLTDTAQYDNGVSDYNAFKLRVRHSGRGFFFDANYTWSKATDTGYTELQDAQGFSDNVGSGGGGANGVLDLLNDRNNKKLSYSDVPHRVVATLTYELPFGKGQRFAMSNAAARAALGGWRIGSVYTWQMGFPLSPTGLNGGSLNGRPDRNAAQNEPLVLPKSLQGWYDGKKSITLPDGRIYTPCAQCYLEFNPDAFVGETLATANGGHQSNLFWWGNAAIDYGALRGPGRNNLDLSLTRDFRFKERYTVSFLANLTNSLNHTQFRPGSFTMGLGAVQVTDIPAQGVTAGESQNAANYGSHNMNTFDPRQMILELRLRF